jgi:hypothetical protein
MTNFTDLRTQLAGIRAQKDASVSRLAIAREQLRDIQAQIAARQRLGDRHDQQGLAELEKQAATLTQQVERLRNESTDHKTNAADLLGRLATLTDPAQQIEELNDAIPILLFPVRLETRFHQPSQNLLAVVAASPQLWVRIYPDDCQVDSFEEMLSQTEVANAREFWASMWRAGGVESQERGAWRALVGGSGSGRATYIVKQYVPTNPGDKPAKVDAQDVVLVIIPEIDLTAAEQAATFTYYIAVWRAEGDKVKENAALAALRATVGNARADDIRAHFVPDAKGQDPPQPYTRAQVRVSCALLKLPPPPPTKTSGWTQSPKASAMPDRFVLMLYNGGVEVKRVIGNPVTDGLAVGPDPSLPPTEQIKQDGDDLLLNDDLLWTADFERAVSVGMGIKVNLTAAESSAGFDRLVVLGMRFSSDEQDARARLETLIAHHYGSKHGFSLVPQGSPTNNTDSDGAAYSWVDDPDTSYDVVFLGKDAFTESNDAFQRRDGQWLAEALDIDDALVKLVPNAAGRDQGEARAMNVALWQATLGYAMEEMMTPLFSREDIAATRWFFTRYVSGRGPIPGVRIGKQPYGILPAMAFSRYRSTHEGGGIFRPALAGDYLQRLHSLLSRLDTDWKQMSAGVAHIGQAGDKHQVLLDVVGLHSGAVEFHQRYAESFDQLYNKLVLELGVFWGGLVADWLKRRSQELLSRLGTDPNAQLPILEKFFYGESALLGGPVVDDVPLSESKPVRAYTPDKKNYIEWLASSSLDAVRRQDFGGNPEPTALLYLFLRHAMMLGHWDAGIRLLESRALVDSTIERREPAFVHVQSASSAGQSKFKHLYAPRPEITGSNTTTLSEYILLPSVLNNAVETVDLRELVSALAFLKDSPTARLERTFAEHIDCCTYRLDAWKTGIAVARLEEMRAARDQEKASGIYLGGFAWLEDLRPKTNSLTPVNLEPELAKVFQRPKDAPLQHDLTNAGYIHAPSLNHATAAAILKNAYKVNASPQNPDAMAVNLSSDRVRRALSVLEGVRNGQTLPALLGYRFERGLHDEHNLAEVDKFIYPLRQAFPLVAKRLKNTRPDDKTDITLLEARNVIDGVKLVNQIRTSGQKSYPFGMPSGTDPGKLPPATDGERTAIDAEADALMNLYDAIADLVMAESVYQVVQGNFDRAAANTNAFSQGNRPPEIEVVDTPLQGLALTHRVALHLDPNANPTVSPNTVAMTPRAQAEAPLNFWFAGRLPDPARVVVRVTYTTPSLGAPKTVTISQADLALQPMDLLYLVNLDLDQAQSELDDRIVQVVRYGADAHPDMDLTIEYTKGVADKTKITLLELAALVRSARALLLKSRPVGPIDMAMPLEGKSDGTVWNDAELKVRVNQAITTLTKRRDDLVLLKADAADLDGYARKVSDAFLLTALSGVPQTGTGQIHRDMRGIYEAIANKVREFVTRWEGQSAEFAVLIATLPGLGTDDERFALLQKAEGLIAVTVTTPLPANPGIYAAAVNAKKLQFDNRLQQLKDLLKFAGTKLVDFAAAAAALKPLLAVHDPAAFDIAGPTAAINTLRDTLVARVTALADDLTQRITDAAKAVTDSDALTSPEARVEKLRTAARLVLGDEMQMVPRFKLADDRGLEFNNCVAGSGALLTDLKAGGRRFPLDDWLYGLARVRDKLNAWENVTILSEGFGAASLGLAPVQLPFRADDRWLGLQFDPAKAGPGNRVLYTAHFATPFNRSADQCGLLLDEWTELVPGTEVTSGVTFHFDRPSSQPPQTMLLAVPAALSGRWNWSDLVQTIHETLDAAKARAVEPAQVDESSYAQFLPATLMAVTLYQINIATNLALNNRVYDFIRS